MNIFYLHHDVRKCAKYHVDRHVVKMIIEYCQLLCTAIWLSGGKAPLKKTHENHPCAIWARKSSGNWLWLQELALALCAEYTFRYEKQHKLQAVLESLQVPEIPKGEFFQPPQAMPEEYKQKDSKDAYRCYYVYGKNHLFAWKSRHAWKNRKIPKFIRISLSPEELSKIDCF
jgi:hypothetical protein